MATTIRITGVADLARRFQATPAQIAQLSADLARDVARLVYLRARNLVPVATGALQRSITRQQIGPAAWLIGVAGDSGGDRNPASYARFVEYGTSRAAAQPFMRPASEQGAAAVPPAVQTMAARLPGRVRAS